MIQTAVMHMSEPSSSTVTSGGNIFIYGALFLKPDRRRERVDKLDTAYQVGKKRACSVVGIQRTSYYYKSRGMKF